jgi:hypothetical protein
VVFTCSPTLQDTAWKLRTKPQHSSLQCPPLLAGSSAGFEGFIVFVSRYLRLLRAVKRLRFCFQARGCRLWHCGMSHHIWYHCALWRGSGVTISVSVIIWSTRVNFDDKCQYGIRLMIVNDCHFTVGGASHGYIETTRDFSPCICMPLDGLSSGHQNSAEPMPDIRSQI